MYQIDVLENLRRIFITNKYSKTLRPLFGLNRHIDKRADLFSLLELKNDILTQISLYEPRINPVLINFTQENGLITCEITYTQENETKFLRLNV
ncbi:MAG: GPW/gp25 family protein [Campylobacter sp.]